MPETQQTTPTGEATDLVQSVLDSDVLGGYLHLSESPERRPLEFVNATSAAVDLGSLTAGGEPVTAVTEPTQNALQITRIETAEADARVDFKYAPEGIRGTAKLTKKTSGWAVSSVSVVES